MRAATKESQKRCTRCNRSKKRLPGQQVFCAGTVVIAEEVTPRNAYRTTDRSVYRETQQLHTAHQREITLLGRSLCEACAKHAARFKPKQLVCVVNAQIVLCPVMCEHVRVRSPPPSAEERERWANEPFAAQAWIPEPWPPGSVLSKPMPREPWPTPPSDPPKPKRDWRRPFRKPKPG